MDMATSFTPYYYKSIDTSTFTLTLNSGSLANMRINNLAGSGSIVVGSMVELSGTSSTFTGSYVVTGGIMVFGSNAAVGSPSSLTVSNTGNLLIIDTFGDNDYLFPIILSGADNSYVGTKLTTLDGYSYIGPGSSPAATVTLHDVTLNSDINYSGNVDLNIVGSYTANAHTISVVSGYTPVSVTTPSGTVEVQPVTNTIASADKLGAPVSVFDKVTTILNGERGSAYVYSGGILKGIGNVTGAINIATGGTLAPGQSPGCITSGGLTLAGSYDVEIAGKTVCTEYDQTKVTGTVDVTGATLNTSFLNSYVPALNDTFTIIDNDAADAVTGTFTGMANGSTFVLGTVTFRINYDGGDGNDVVLTATVVPAVPDTGAEQILTSPLATFMAAIATLGLIFGFRYAQKKQ